jgi:peptidyl-Lys metalloendopeptidase
MKIQLLFVFIILFNFWGCNGFNIWLSTSTTSFLRGSHVIVTVHMSNPKTEGSIFLLKWGTPFETHSGFQVLLNNVTVPYEGIMAHRFPTPTTSDYVEIQSGETKTLQSQLWQNFDFRKVGIYHIRLVYFIRGYLISPLGEKIEFEPFSGLSNELMIEILESEAPSNHPFHPSAFHVLAPYDCTATQMSYINTAWSTSKSAINTAASFTSGSSKYTLWFGATTSAREQRVRTVLGKLKSLTSLKYNCGGPSCSSNTYGYVYPTDSAKNVYLCALFWNNPPEAVRTIVHEATHFNDVGATQDYAYGQSSCQNLAKSSPDKAIYNADNHCYFV